MVFDYRRTDLGAQASVNNLPVVLVDGQLYVEYLPEKLRMAGYRWANRGRVIDKVLQVNPDTGEAYTVAERDQHLAARQPYALIPKGRPDADGYQRFTYPDRRAYIAFDPATGKRTRSSLSGSVTIPPQKRVVKQIQRYPWKSPMWKSVYGQRNQVESSNKNLKDGRFAELDNPKKRSGRGEAFQFLAVTLYVVATNIRRIVTTLRNEFKASPRTKNRARRRHDEAGLPLTGTAQSGNQALAPPV